MNDIKWRFGDDHFTISAHISGMEKYMLRYFSLKFLQKIK